MRTPRASAVTATLLIYAACQGSLFTIQIEESAVTLVEEGTLLEDLLGDMGFGEFVSMDLTEAEEIQNQGVEPGDIQDVYLTTFELEVLSPSGGDMAFLDRMQIYVESPGLPKALVASRTSFPSGVRLVSFELEPVDLTDYVVSESLTLTTEVTGRRPEDDTQIEARFVLDVGVTGQGACNQANRGAEDEEEE